MVGFIPFLYHFSYHMFIMFLVYDFLGKLQDHYPITLPQERLICFQVILSKAKFCKQIRNVPAFIIHKIQQDRYIFPDIYGYAPTGSGGDSRFFGDVFIMGK
jgi:hypothetical protein